MPHLLLSFKVWVNAIAVQSAINSALVGAPYWSLITDSFSFVLAKLRIVFAKLLPKVE